MRDQTLAAMSLKIIDLFRTRIDEHKFSWQDACSRFEDWTIAVGIQFDGLRSLDYRLRSYSTESESLKDQLRLLQRWLQDGSKAPNNEVFEDIFEELNDIQRNFAISLEGVTDVDIQAAEILFSMSKK